MITAIVSSAAPVTLVGGGETGVDDLECAFRLAPTVVAADGGAATALAMGHVPEAVIGDFDSLLPGDRARLPRDRLFPIREQESTDFDKALRHIAAPVVLGVGFLGARVDHQLAAFHTLLRHADRPCILLGRQELVLHLPRLLRLPLHEGDIVSLFPLLPVSGRSDGLLWPIEGLDFLPGSRIGTSNRATGAVTLEMAAPGMLAMVPRSALAALLTRLAALPPDARWPARA